MGWTFPSLLASTAFFSGMLKFIMSLNSILCSLIVLEFMALAVFFLSVVITNSNLTDLHVSLVLLTIMVCDGVLGVSMMLLSTRVSGDQLLMNNSMLTW
uniref:NADH dehydrogenase subunit 4L n=1 Tax=Gyge ovalis TaxID=2008693 RepID=A0A343DSC4_9CRUS|nr:NADH dehydrogenase subunit 4L [Gyge ovalis]ASC43031.1 NADH dehydrogenase subunit 4L [Gyge ovalis]